MRYLPNFSGNTAAAFNPGARPDLEKLPAELADLIRERDAIMERAAVARARVQELSGEHNDTAAQLADETAATAAARSGHDIPEPVAVPKLSDDRAEAVRALTAMDTALRDVTSECEQAAGQMFFDGEEKAAAVKAKRRAEVEKAAVKLADLVDEAVDQGSVRDWMRTGVYFRRADVYPTDVIPDLTRHGLDRSNCGWFPVREVVIGAALAALDDE